MAELKDTSNIDNWELSGWVAVKDPTFVPESVEAELGQYHPDSSFYERYKVRTQKREDGSVDEGDEKRFFIQSELGNHPLGWNAKNRHILPQMRHYKVKFDKTEEYIYEEVLKEGGMKTPDYEVIETGSHYLSAIWDGAQGENRAGNHKLQKIESFATKLRKVDTLEESIAVIARVEWEKISDQSIVYTSWSWPWRFHESIEEMS